MPFYDRFRPRPQPVGELLHLTSRPNASQNELGRIAHVRVGTDPVMSPAREPLLRDYAGGFGNDVRYQMPKNLPLIIPFNFESGRPGAALHVAERTRLRVGDNRGSTNHPWMRIPVGDGMSRLVVRRRGFSPCSRRSTHGLDDPMSSFPAASRANASRVRRLLQTRGACRVNKHRLHLVRRVSLQ
jgi:hypothetical protein